MWEAGLVAGSAGNISRRMDSARIAITPSSVPYEALREDQIVTVSLSEGTAENGVPSYELPMHLAVYRARTDVEAIVHTHAPFVTTLSILRRSLPPVIDEMIVHLGGEIAVADYAFTGTEEVGSNVLRALGERQGVILANHGNVCVGATLERALHSAIVMESCARAYVQALMIGNPVPLPTDAVTAGRRLFEERLRG